MPGSDRQLNKAHVYASPNRRMKGSELRGLRIAAGLSQGALAKAMGWNRNRIKRKRGGYENVKEFELHPVEMDQLLKTLGVSKAAKPKYKRTAPHKCQRCGMCCKNRGDFAFDCDDIGHEVEPDDCTALVFDGNIAICRMEECKRDCCSEYPGDEWCERELREKGLWEKYKRH